MGRKTPRGINTFFRQSGSVLKAARQTEIFSRIKRNIPYFVKKLSTVQFFSKKYEVDQKSDEKKIKITKKLSEFAKKVK